MKVAFTESYTDIKDYRGYRLLAVDGPDLHITTDSADTDTYFQTFSLLAPKKTIGIGLLPMPFRIPFHSRPCL